jgi:hypothetical protein
MQSFPPCGCGVEHGWPPARFFVVPPAFRQGETQRTAVYQIDQSARAFQFYEFLPLKLSYCINGSLGQALHTITLES